jgi:SAM-dependent methyltransferase
VEQLSEVNDRQKEIFSKLVDDSGGQSYLDSRMAAYLFRWREALVFARKGSAVLDVGGGWISDEIFKLIIEEHQLNYHLIDIDNKVINAAQVKLARSGKPIDQAILSDNSQIPFPDASFDFLFSSHCLEHSVDLGATFAEIRRVLKCDGVMFFAVPFGFEEPVEHNYCLGIEEWSALVEAAGFRIVNVNVGRNYVSVGWDLSICAQIGGDPSPERIGEITGLYCKSGKTLIHHSDAAFDFRPPDVERAHGACMREVGSSCFLDIKDRLAALLVFRNAWAGTLKIEGTNGVQYVNAYSGIDWLSAVDISRLRGPIVVTVVGGDSLGHAIQGGLFGVLVYAELGKRE